VNRRRLSLGFLGLPFCLAYTCPNHKNLPSAFLLVTLRRFSTFPSFRLVQLYPPQSNKSEYKDLAVALLCCVTSGDFGAARDERRNESERARCQTMRSCGRNPRYVYRRFLDSAPRPARAAVRISAASIPAFSCIRMISSRMGLYSSAAIEGQSRQLLK